MLRWFLAPLLLAFSSTAFAAPADPMQACLNSGKYWNAPAHACEVREKDADLPEPKLNPGCTWKTTYLVLDATTRPMTMSFRYQSCAAPLDYQFDPATKSLYRNVIKPENRVAQFWTMVPGGLSLMVTALNQPTLSHDEASDCDVAYTPKYRAFFYAPTQYYLNDLQLTHKPFTACGVYGFDSQKIQMFRVLDDKILAFFRLDADDPLDAQSFSLAP